MGSVVSVAVVHFSKMFKNCPLGYGYGWFLFLLTQNPAKNLTMFQIQKFNCKKPLVLISMLWYPKYIDIWLTPFRPPCGAIQGAILHPLILWKRPILGGKYIFKKFVIRFYAYGQSEASDGDSAKVSFQKLPF